MREKIPEGWKRVKLGEVVNIMTGKLNSNAEEIDGKYPFFTCAPKPSRINKYDYDLDAILLAGNNANGIFHIHRYKGKFNAYQRTYIITKKDKENSLDYIFFSLKLLLNYMKEISFGSATRFLTMGILKNLEILLPPLPEQKAIASVLSSLDDKIDLLHRQNKTLEQMAETLFRKWFIEDVKKDWEYSTLGNYVKVYKGVSYKSSELNNSNVALVTLKNFGRDGSLKFDGFKEYTGKYKEEHIVKSGDLVIAQTDITQNADIIGNPLLIFNLLGYEKLVISMDVIKVEPKNEWLSKEFLYYLMKTKSFKEHCIGFSNGSTVLHLSKDAIPNFEFFVPPKEKVVFFTEKVKMLIEKIHVNLTQIYTLEKLRDSLLPKLMKGDVRVKN